MDAHHIQPSADSVILAFGTTKNPRSRRYWLWTILLLGCLLGFLAFLWAMLNRSIQIPHRTALLVSLSPRAAKDLPEPLREALSPSWKTALHGSSRWPSVLGAYRTDDGWKNFALIPTWYGSHRLIQEIPFSSSTRAFRLTEAWAWSVWLDSRYVFLNDVSDDMKIEPFTGTWRDRSLLTDLQMTEDHAATTLIDTDLSFQRNRDGSVWSILEFLTEYRELFHAIRNSGAEPSSVSGSLSSSGTQQSLLMSFFDPLSEEQASVILSGARLDDRRTKTLDDGEVVSERIGLTASSGTLFRVYEQTVYGEFDLQPAALSINRPVDQPLVSRCSGVPMVHVSALTVRQLLKSVNVHTESGIETGITLSDENGKMRVCFE